MTQMTNSCGNVTIDGGFQRSASLRGLLFARENRSGCYCVAKIWTAAARLTGIPLESVLIAGRQ